MVAAIDGGGIYLSVVMMDASIFNISRQIEKCVGRGAERLFHCSGITYGLCALTLKSLLLVGTLKPCQRAGPQALTIRPTPRLHFSSRLAIFKFWFTFFFSDLPSDCVYIGSQSRTGKLSNAEPLKPKRRSSTEPLPTMTSGAGCCQGAIWEKSSWPEFWPLSREVVILGP